MVTIFHTLMLLAVVGVAALGGAVGWHLFGVPGAIVGTFAGLVVGGVLGQIPLVIGMLMVGRRFETMTTDALREHLHSGECSMPNLVLLELHRRGENIEGELPLLQSLLSSDDVQQRTRGWVALQSAFPDRASRISQYRPFGSTQECQRHARTLGEG